MFSKNLYETKLFPQISLKEQTIKSEKKNTFKNIKTFQSECLVPDVPGRQPSAYCPPSGLAPGELQAWPGLAAKELAGMKHLFATDQWPASRDWI